MRLSEFVRTSWPTRSERRGRDDRLERSRAVSPCRARRRKTPRRGRYMIPSASKGSSRTATGPCNRPSRRRSRAGPHLRPRIPAGSRAPILLGQIEIVLVQGVLGIIAAADHAPAAEITSRSLPGPFRRSKGPEPSHQARRRTPPPLSARSGPPSPCSPQASRARGRRLQGGDWASRPVF